MAVLLRKIRSFLRVPVSTKLLFLEAFFASAYVKATLLFFPFKKVAGWLGSAHGADATELNAQQRALVRQIDFSIRLCQRYAPWPTECYTTSLTAKKMLRRRKIGSVLYFGFGKDEHGKLKGHAWLKCGDMVVTGHCDFSQYQVHSSFS